MKKKLKLFNSVAEDNEPRVMPEQDIIDHNWKPIVGLDNIVDSCINMEVCLPQGEQELYGKVIRLCMDKSGQMIGSPNDNPFINTVL